MRSSWISIVRGGSRCGSCVFYATNLSRLWSLWMNDASTHRCVGSGSFQPTAALLKLWVKFRAQDYSWCTRERVFACVCMQAWCSHLCKLFSVICRASPLFNLLLSPLLVSSPLFLQPLLLSLFTLLCSLCVVFCSSLFHSCFFPTQTLFSALFSSPLHHE